MEQRSASQFPQQLVVSSYLSLRCSGKLETLVSRGLDGLVRDSASQSGIIWVYDGRALQSVAVTNTPLLLSLLGSRLSLGQGLTGRCAAESRPLASSDIASDERMALRQVKYYTVYSSAAAAPATLTGRLAGAVTVFDKVSRQYTAEDLTRLRLGVERLALIMSHCVRAPEYIDAWIDQLEIDMLAGKTIPQEVSKQDRDTLPKGISRPTLNMVLDALGKMGKPSTCEELVACTGISYKTVRRYLCFLVDSALVKQEAAYGSVGRPAYMYSVPEPGNSLGTVGFLDISANATYVQGSPTGV